jgi:uncharacterized protein
MQNNAPTYTELEQALLKTTFKLHPSQAHGIICGLFCGKTDPKDSWVELVTGSESAPEAVQALYAQTEKQLTDFLFEFQLLLPEDSENLTNRAEALTLWCQGFLTGLKAAHVQLQGREQNDVTEAINDVIEIAKMNYEEVVASEEDEEAFVELVEYVRMATILIYQELHESTDAKQTSSNHLH